MLRQVMRRHHRTWGHIIMLIALTALLSHVMMESQYAVDTESAPVCVHQGDLLEEFVLHESIQTSLLILPVVGHTCRFAHRDLPSARLLATAIFHPPQTA